MVSLKTLKLKILLAKKHKQRKQNRIIDIENFMKRSKGPLKS